MIPSRIFGDSAFRECSGLESIIIPGGVTSIGNSAFSGCSSLESITIAKSVTSIGSMPFYNCDKLQSIKGKKGSYAETWANENGYTFIAQ